MKEDARSKLAKLPYGGGRDHRNSRRQSTQQLPMAVFVSACQIPPRNVTPTPGRHWLQK
jgi:hypothetical protein